MLKVTRTIHDSLKKLTQALKKAGDDDVKPAMRALVEKQRKLLYDLKFADEMLSEHFEHFFAAFDALDGLLEQNECANMWDSWLCGPDEASRGAASCARLRGARRGDSHRAGPPRRAPSGRTQVHRG